MSVNVTLLFSRQQYLASAEAYLRGIADGGDAEGTIAKFAKAGIDCDTLATDLQRDAAGSFVKDWHEMLASIASKISGFKAAA